MHFVGPDQLHGFVQRLTKDIQPASFALTPDWKKGIYLNHGTSVGRLKKPGVIKSSKILDFDNTVLQRTLEQIRTYKRRSEEESRPFFLCASFFHPHGPFQITEEYWEMYEDSEIPMPADTVENIGDLHPFNQWIQTHHGVDVCDLTEDEIRRNRRAYYGMVTYFDNKVGQIVHELEQSGLIDNTIIVVTSDHGEMLGEHGMWFKRTFYEHATKIPLILSYPKRFPRGKKVSRPVSLVDLAPTFMTLANVPDCEKWINEMDGNSLESLIVDEDKSWKDEVICEYYGEGPIQPMIMLRSGNYKFVYVHEERPLLFDLEKDPHELNDLAKLTDYESLVEKFTDRITSQFNMEKIKRDIIRSQQERLLIVDSLDKGEKVNWDYIPNSHSSNLAKN